MHCSWSCSSVVKLRIELSGGYILLLKSLVGKAISHGLLCDNLIDAEILLLLMLQK